MTTFVIIIALSIGISTILVLMSLMYTAFRYAPFVPSKNKIVKQMIEAAELKDGDRVYDLGCGDGRLLRESRKAKDVEAIGIEASWLVSLLARLIRVFSKVKYKIIHGNFFESRLDEADVVFCYLFPNVMLKLQPKFESELKEGARVISHSFPIKAWQPVRTIQTKADKPKNFLIYVYEVPKSYGK